MRNALARGGVGLLVIGALIAGACGSSAEVEVAGETTPTSEAAATGEATPEPKPTEAPEPTATPVPETEPAAAPAGLPPECQDFGFASSGDVLGVVGVRFDSQLELRDGPGPGLTVVGSAAPTERDVVATGQNCLLESDGLFYEITLGTTTGWADAKNLAFFAGVGDGTANVVAELGFTPTAGTMEELGRIVAEAFLSDEEEAPSRVTMAVAPSFGDLAEVTYDVIGFADDSVLGVRLHVFGQPDDKLFSLASVEVTTLCARGASGDLCV